MQGLTIDTRDEQAGDPKVRLSLAHAQKNGVLQFAVGEISR